VGCEESKIEMRFGMPEEGGWVAVRREDVAHGMVEGRKKERKKERERERE